MSQNDATTTNDPRSIVSFVPCECDNPAPHGHLHTNVDGEIFFLDLPIPSMTIGRKILELILGNDETKIKIESGDVPRLEEEMKGADLPEIYKSVEEDQNYAVNAYGRATTPPTIEEMISQLLGPGVNVIRL